MKKVTEQKIEGILKKCVKGALARTESNKTYRPFHEVLLTRQIVNASSFERSFSTSFGQGPIEEISEIIAQDNGYETQRQRETHVNVYKGAIDEIERICSALRAGQRKPSWENEVRVVQAYQRGDTEVRRVISDLWLKKEGVETFISIKTVKPNLDQTEIAKKDLLLLKAHNRNYKTFFGLFYNPGGKKRSDYNWSMPSKIFDMHRDSVVLIGEEYWDMLGGIGTYSALLKIFARVGRETRKAISKL